MSIPSVSLSRSITPLCSLAPEDCTALEKVLNESENSLAMQREEDAARQSKHWGTWIGGGLYYLFKNNSVSYKRSAFQAFQTLTPDCRYRIYSYIPSLNLPTDVDKNWEEKTAFRDLDKVVKAIGDFARAVFNSLEPVQRVTLVEDKTGKVSDRLLLHFLSELDPYRDLILQGIDAWRKQKEGTAEEIPVEVIGRFRDFFYDNCESALDLSHLSLTDLPDIFHFPPFAKNLNRLNLEYNEFAAIPETLRHLERLEYIKLNQNCLLSLPDWMGDFPALNAINLSRNYLIDLPPSFRKLHNLTWIDIEHNAFDKFPEVLFELTRLNRIYLENNTGLTALPEQISVLPKDCRVHFSGCSIPLMGIEKMLERTDEPDYAGPALFPYSNDLSPSRSFSIDECLDFLYYIIRQEPRRFPSLIAKEKNAARLRNWLSRLIDMADYQNRGKSKVGLAAAIVKYLEWAEEDDAFRAIFFAVIKKASATCGDRMALSVLHLGLAYQISRADRSRMRDFSELLLRGVFAMDLLERFARQRIEEEEKRLYEQGVEDPKIDEIEVYLGLPVMLKEKLSLPIDVANMLFFRASILKPEDLDRAEAHVKKCLADSGACCKFLIGQTEWMQALKAKYPEGYAAAEEKIDDLLDATYDDPSKMSEVEKEREKLFSELTSAAIR